MSSGGRGEPKTGHVEVPTKPGCNRQDETELPN